MVILEDHTEEGYLIMTLQEIMRPKEKMYWILEELPSFFQLSSFLSEDGIKCGDFGGFVEMGRVLFHSQEHELISDES